MIERKCTKCGTWNKDEDHCTSCGAALSPKAIDQEKEIKRKEEEANKQPSKFDLFLEKSKNSKFWIVRVGYYIMYSVTLIVGAFGAFVAWMVAMANA
ncbi:MAG: hypothetical protein H6582_07705 [Crocinitomicaceae bacterium]|nr:hypothetical protein [Crocinitomicaceae bacterium]